jgi:hypothetical protein
MYFPDDRCCDRSGAHGGAFGALDLARHSCRQPEALPVSHARNGPPGSLVCGGFLHPAAALLQRVLHLRAFDTASRSPFSMCSTVMW